MSLTCGRETPGAKIEQILPGVYTMLTRSPRVLGGGGDEMLHVLPLSWYSLVAPPSPDASLIPPLLVMLMECSGDRTGVGTDFQIRANPG